MLQNLFSCNHNFSITLNLTMVRFPHYPQNVFDLFLNSEFSEVSLTACGCHVSVASFQFRTVPLPPHDI